MCTVLSRKTSTRPSRRSASPPGEVSARVTAPRAGEQRASAAEHAAETGPPAFCQEGQGKQSNLFGSRFIVHVNPWLRSQRGGVWSDFFSETRSSHGQVYIDACIGMHRKRATAPPLADFVSSVSE